MSYPMQVTSKFKWTHSYYGPAGMPRSGYPTVEMLDTAKLLEGLGGMGITIEPELSAAHWGKYIMPVGVELPGNTVHGYDLKGPDFHLGLKNHEYVPNLSRLDALTNTGHEMRIGGTVSGEDGIYGSVLWTMKDPAMIKSYALMIKDGQSIGEIMEKIVRAAVKDGVVVRSPYQIADGSNSRLLKNNR